ncbi:SpaH/EbpB family LPXTG-anchored major pilin [Pseudoglutamicibacter cumminsii]|uniref:SpaH/EbpB family LPXTG-anchored major pilin n=1 Tax=Pseudoglutamicibacter cumminsii TaxID=156979 RepID=A0AAP4C6M6_9MICC|nr:SpaH/EbpB family LPXTG-anchored major pilin [Pseudoglutamicibacter cumminsii]MBM7795069.1 fimbrial isopeptide formation D2 family protein/LPXTG-motif cell wall-anchored protein [Pseudoglutamicibacter cumminsii]MDK6274420.1 SpaH/EbpB family LPXTG-anchored major pilin [Pseudoglutamicibacter cumminsii]MDK7082438.1 SpaH/EbpB family LPXTG-anchored major pilin [Pseudoglutamicibacter cumminsii]MDZ3745461.1 SpaH/EbpB family LPXTG-anchored major pilin [Pseudoglutamicibacter cumminsii]
MTSFSKAVRAASVAAMLGLSVGVSAPAVLAAPAVTAPAKGNIDFSKKGSLTLFKKKGAESSEAATGKEMQNVPGEPLNGVTFKITKLNFDLQNGDWKTFPKTAADVKDADKTGTTFEQTTAGEGVAKFSDLPLGIYLVEETNTPDGIVAGAPFIVSVPMVNEASDAWNYDVIAYPKNTETKTEKTVKDADKHIQDAYTYTINADAPTWGEGKQLTAFRFEDQLDQRLDFQKVTEVKAGNTVLQAGDYTVNKPAENGNKLVVTLTEQGLAKVKSGDKLLLTFDVKRKEVGDTTELKNQAEVIFNNPNTGNEVKNKTNEVVTYHGKLKVVKKDGKETGKVLEGAEFELYQCTSAENLGAQVTVKNVSKWTTGADGTISIDGLHVTDFEDNKEAPATKKFCLKETKAPAGYVLPEKNVTEIDFTRENIAKTGEFEGDDEVTLVSEIENIKQDTPNLPMTGGAGVGVLGALGALIAGSGVWFARRNAKQSQAE